MTNRCSAYLAALEAEAATYEVLAIGECTTRLCRTHSYFDAACEADEMAGGKLPLPVAADYLVVLSPQGKQCGDKFPVKRPEVPKPVAPPAPPQPWDFAGLFAWSLVVAGVVMFGYWLGSQ